MSGRQVKETLPDLSTSQGTWEKQQAPEARARPASQVHRAAWADEKQNIGETIELQEIHKSQNEDLPTYGEVMKST